MPDMLRVTEPATHPVSGLSRREMDVCLTQLAGAMDVDCMAGASDPANHALPQQPLHPCLLPGATSFPSFHRCPCALPLQRLAWRGSVCW